MPELPRRNQVPTEETWSAETVFASPDAWEAEFARVDGLLAGFAAHQGRLSESAQALAEALALRDEVGLAMRRVALYARMLRAADTGDQAAGALASRAEGLAARFSAATAFYEPELLGLPPGRLEEWAGGSPELAVYRHSFRTLDARRGHVRSEEVESLLAAASDPLGALSTAANVLANADMTFAPVPDAAGGLQDVAQATVSVLTCDPDAGVRRRAWESYADGYLGVKNTLAALLAGRVRQTVMLARARNYPSSLDAALAPNAIPPAVFHTLLSTFQDNLPIWHRYWRVLRGALGVERLHNADVPTYEVPAPIVRSAPPLPFGESSDMICRGMGALGGEYVGAMRRGLTGDRWVDRTPSRGKANGAFSTGVQGTCPFIMMNYQDDIFSLSTLAHELGHSMHSYLSWQTQPTVYAGYSLFVAEVASNFNQALVRGHLLDTHTERDFVLGVVEEAIANFHRYLFVMPTLARFEWDCHQKVERGEALTADGMSATLAGFFREGYGDAVDIDDARLGITWAQFSHLYSPFYVYQYATGISAANALAEDVRAEGAPAVARYLSFLKAGGSLYPLDALALAGIDMTSPDPIRRAFAVLSRLVDRLEALV